MLEDFIIKVCGITTASDAQGAVDAGANALGFNFYDGSPRCIAPEMAAEISTLVRGKYLRVGVFVNASEEQVRAVSSVVRLDVVQMHGSTPVLTGLRNWRATQVTPRLQVEKTVEAYLLDTFSPVYGGSGKTFDWSLANGVSYRAIVAGGLDGTNVSEAIGLADPWGVDACSRLEAQPGRKDQKRVSAFVSAAMSAFTLNRKLRHEFHRTTSR